MFMMTAQSRFAGLPGVRQISLGVKHTNLTPSRRRCLRIGVSRKIDDTELPDDQRIPRTFYGVPTDVVPLRGPIALTCPISDATQTLTEPLRPGGWVGAGNNWGSVCLYFTDGTGRVLALTARHVVSGGGAVLGARLQLPTRVGCPADETVAGTVVRVTGIQAQFYDGALVHIDDADAGRVGNVPYGSRTRIRSCAGSTPEPDTAVRFHGAKTSLRVPHSGSVVSSGVFMLDGAPNPLPGVRGWIEIAITLARGDSGGLFTVNQGRSALALLQFGRPVSAGSRLANLVYATPIRELLDDFAQPASAGAALVGFENLSLQIL